MKTLAFDETLFKGAPNAGVVTLLAGGRVVGGGHVGSMRLRAAAKLIRA